MRTTPLPRVGLGLVCTALLLVGCRPAAPTASRPLSGSALHCVDALGRRVQLEQPPRRIAALSPATSEIVFAVGCGAQLVLRDRASDYPPAVRALPATDPFRLSVEHIAGFAPQLVLASHLDTTRAAGLEEVGLKVAVFDPGTVAQMLDDIVAIGTLCGRPEAARRLVRQSRARLAEVQRRVRGRAAPKVYVELDGSDPLKPWTIGSRSLVGDVLRLAAGRNIFADIRRSAAQVGAEAVLQRAPEVILLAATGARFAARAQHPALARPGWAGLPAVVGGRVIDAIDPALLTRPGPRLVQGVEALARALHPEAFAAATAAR